MLPSSWWWNSYRVFLLTLMVRSVICQYNFNGQSNWNGSQPQPGPKLQALLQVLKDKRPLSTVLNFNKNISEFAWQLDQTYFKHGVYPRNPSRLHKALRKALNGRQVTLLIIGGSNSAGGGIDKREGSLQDTYYGVFRRWWTSTITPLTGSQLKVHRIAIGGTGSALFAFCFETFLPQNEVIDIVMVEQSMNFDFPGKAKPLEQLTRRLFEYHSAPDIMFVNLVGMLVDESNTQCINLENFGQTEIAARYGITSFSMKDIVCPLFGGKRMKNNDLAAKMASKDTMHISLKAHAHIGTMIINQIRQVLDVILENQYQLRFSNRVLPEPLFLTNPREILANPSCATSVTPDFENARYNPSLDVKIILNRGFSFYTKPYINYFKDNDYEPIPRRDRQRGWVAENSGSSISFGFNVTSWESKNDLERSRSVNVVVRHGSIGGKAVIYLDNQRGKGITIETISARGTNDIYTIATRVPPGYHTVKAEVQSEGNFMIIGFLVGPPEFCCRYL